MDDSHHPPHADRWPVLAPRHSVVVPSLQTPTFSVVIAAYNAAGFIGAAIESVLHQSVGAHEIVVCDDASTDETVKIVQAYDSHVTLLRSERNRGCAASRNEALRAASGDFIVILDADDRFLPERIEALGEAARERPDLDILTTDAYVEVDGKTVGRYYGPHWAFEIEDQRSEILRRNFVFIAAATRREAVLAAGSFDDTKRRTEDWDLWIRMIFSGSMVGCVDAPLAVYADRPDSVSSDHPRMVRSELHTLRKAAALSTLSVAERAIVNRTIASNEREVLRQDVRAAIVEGSSDARRLSWRLVVHPGTRVRTRLKAAAALVAPSLFGWYYRRRQEQSEGDMMRSTHSSP